MYIAQKASTQPVKIDYLPETMVVLPDTHITTENASEGGIDERAWACALEAIDIVEPDMVVHLGDLGEWNSASPWKYKRVKRPPLPFVLDEHTKELAVVNTYLDDLDEVCGDAHKVLLKGNHEVWVDNLFEENHHVDKDLSIEHGLRLPNRQYQVYPYGQYVKVGHLHLVHGGHYTGINHARSTALKTRASVMYGHFHDIQSAGVSGLTNPSCAWSIGCLSDNDKAFLKGSPTNWEHGLAIVHYQPDGTFNVEQVRIFNGRCYVYGYEITA